MFKQSTTKTQIKELCQVCGKPVASGKVSSNVTRFLFWESRCQCDRSKITDSPFVSPKIVVADASDGPASKVKVSERPNSVKLKVYSEAENDATFANVLKFIPSYYRPLEVLGEGGMGIVLKVEDTTDGKLYAIKLLRASFLDDDATLKRFEKEAEAAMLLHHPGIVSAREYGLGQGQVPYMVMDFVEGECLADRLKRGPIQINEALDIFIAIGEALEYAHEQGVIHRDIKPSNVMLVKDPASGRTKVKLVDFGIARIILSGKGSACSLTQTGEIFGSPHYMSPEQCLGQESDASSDIYAFSCLMYECVSGQTPFVGTNSVKIILSHLEENPAPLTDVLKKQAWYRKVGPHNLERYKYLSLMLAHGLEKDRKYRYDTTPYVMSQLRNCAKGNMRLYYIPSTKRNETNRKVNTTAGVIALFLVVLSASMWYGFQSSGSTDYGKFALDGDYRSMDGEKVMNVARDYARRRMWGPAIRLSEFTLAGAIKANKSALVSAIYEQRADWKDALKQHMDRAASLKKQIADASDPTLKAKLLAEQATIDVDDGQPDLAAQRYLEAIHLQGVDPMQKAEICTAYLNSDFSFSNQEALHEIENFAKTLPADSENYSVKMLFVILAARQYDPNLSIPLYEKAFSGINPDEHTRISRMLRPHAHAYYNLLLGNDRKADANKFYKLWIQRRYQ